MNKVLKTIWRWVFLFNAIFLAACQEKSTPALFCLVPESKTHIDFHNSLTQTSHFNIIEYLYFYNGGGVAIGDINNDGLQDVYFTANQLQNKLYLNRGDFVFDDITEDAGVAGTGNWKTGAAMADVNGDGLLDIFVCGVGGYKLFNGENQLLINNGDLTFTDATKKYGLTFQGLSTHASFFDYDSDGDLDLYLLNHSVHSVRSYGQSRLRYESDSLAGDKLYRNELIPEGRHRFTEVTSQSGIYNSQLAYGLGVGISDLNFDGAPDIYISNDFHENDYLYINSGDGTFHEDIERLMPHVSRFSMGNDIADINNDGRPEIITLDMLPKDEEVIKTTAGEESYDIYQFKLGFGYHHQFARNMLQLNQGFDEDGSLLFSDIAALAGVEASDWSWAPLLADFDNDGYKDLFIANGIVARPNDLDYIHFVSTDSAQQYYEYEEFIGNMPSGSVPNVFYKNEGDLTFSDVTREWIGLKPTVSTGAAYADLDNDGDLDLVVNNINEKATVFRNDASAGAGGWLQIQLKGEGANPFGIGAKLIAYAGKKIIYQEQMLSRGWQSSVSPLLHIGIGQIPSLDSICIIWPDKRFQILTNVPANSRIEVFQKAAHGVWNYNERKRASKPMLSTVTAPAFEHRENDFNAFSSEKLIPHMVSTQGPHISTGDVDRDGLEDFFVGGGPGQPGQLFLQDQSGNFSVQFQPALEADSIFEDVGSALFDANGDGALDLIVVSGGQEFSGNHPALRPRLYLNDGTGMLRNGSAKLPAIFLNASCVKPADIERDGDVDLFIGGRVVAGRYGVSPPSYLLVNDGNGNFINASSRLIAADEKQGLGMVTDAVWCDLNGDRNPDLAVVGEWTPVRVLIQDSNGHFVERTAEYGLGETHGWWNTLYPGDFDRDGDIDLVAGNLGLNTRLDASPRQPVTLYAGDMDDNGGTDHLLTYFNEGQPHPFISRDQLVKQVPSFRREYLKYSNFRNVKREHIIPTSEVSKYAVNHAECFSSVYLENANQKFDIKPLPTEAQMFPVFSFSSGDFNADGHDDLLAVGNLYAVQPALGRYDAGYGLMLLGDGRGNFRAEVPASSGFVVRGEGRSIQSMKSKGGETLYVISRNNDSLLLFGQVAQKPDEVVAR